MRAKTKLIAPVDVDPDVIAEAQAVASAGFLSLDGALIVDGAFSGDYARKIAILSSGDDSTINFTITGTDPDGKAITETLAGSDGAPGTVETDAYFLTVTTIYLDDAATGNVSAGTADELSTNTIPLDRINHNAATVSVEDISGTVNYTVDETMSEIQSADIFEFYEVGQLTSRTSAGYIDINNHASGVRLRINSYDSGANLKIVINQDRAR